METKLYVGNLAYSTSENELQTLFSEAGTVKSVTLIKDQDTGRSKGFAFVEMETQADAQKAISMFNGKQLKERSLLVSMAKPREDRGRGGFERRGGDRSRGRSGGGRSGGGRRSW